MTLMARSPRHYQELGKLVAQVGLLPWDEITEQCSTLLMDGMRTRASAGRHVNAKQHLLGFLKE